MPHRPSFTCDDHPDRVHCYEHHEDEPVGGAYIVCGECFHVWRTAGELRREYRRQFWRTTSHGWFGTDRPSLVSRVWRVLTVRAKDIYFCQHCIHDF